MTDTTPALYEAHGRTMMRIVVPEGVPLSIALPDLGDRAAAFAIDVFICLCCAALIELMVNYAAPSSASDLMMFSLFIFRNGYFIFLEMWMGGVTPGKRALRICVIKRSAGTLDASAIITRNVMRELEFFVPAQMLVASGWMQSGWEVLPVVLWLLFFALFPAFNSAHLRAGDFVAGTVVVGVLVSLLPPDLTDRERRYVFSAAQLKAYGEAELHVLESVLRQDSAADQGQLRAMIFQRIVAKIHWQGKVDDTDVFLQDFYTAQRAHLEHRRQLGRKRKNKHELP